MVPIIPGSSLVPFSDLTEVPHRERRATKRKRISPPSYQLTSQEHIAFVTASKKTQDQKRERSSTKTAKIKAKKSTRKQESSAKTSSQDQSGKILSRTANQPCPGLSSPPLPSAWQQPVVQRHVLSVMFWKIHQKTSIPGLLAKFARHGSTSLAVNSMVYSMMTTSPARVAVIQF